MWNQMLNQLQGRWRFIQSLLNPIQLHIDQVELHQPTIRSRWFQWMSDLYQTGTPYSLAWHQIEKADELLHSQEPSVEITRRHQCGRFLTAAAARADQQTIFDSDAHDGLFGLYLAAGSSTANYWYYASSNPIAWQSSRLTTIDFTRGRLEGNLADSTPQLNQVIDGIDLALIQNCLSYPELKASFLELEPLLRENALVVIDQINATDEVERAWNVIREHSRVLWSAIVEQRLGLVEVGAVE